MTISTRRLLKPLTGLSASGLVLTAYFASSASSPSSLRAFATTMTPHTPWPIKPHTPRPWTYTPADFTRQDPSPDTQFYSAPRFVTHIDDAAIASLREYYATVLPVQRGSKILDFCSSWISHYPDTVAEAAERGDVQITGMGLNQAELDRNAVLNHGRIYRDLNVDADVWGALVENRVLGEGEGLDASTNVVSVDYLTKPVAVLESVRKATRKGGMVHLVVSNRCFPTKAIARWLRVDEGERLQMVGDFLHSAGWSKIEVVELSNGQVEAGQDDTQQGGIQGLMASWIGMGRRDPLWVVRAVNE